MARIRGEVGRWGMVGVEGSFTEVSRIPWPEHGPILRTQGEFKGRDPAEARQAGINWAVDIGEQKSRSELTAFKEGCDLKTRVL